MAMVLSRQECRFLKGWRFGEHAMEQREEGKKHPCADCTFCQWCSDDRCGICRAKKGCARKLSSAEQVALYESINDKGKK